MLLRQLLLFFFSTAAVAVATVTGAAVTIAAVTIAAVTIAATVPTSIAATLAETYFPS
jgi:hypothetical protein